jgi:hypothetical protein
MLQVGATGLNQPTRVWLLSAGIAMTQGWSGGGGRLQQSLTGMVTKGEEP